MMEKALPEVLAPAGDKSCFLAAIAAGADATYMGLKNFSARAGAERVILANSAVMPVPARLPTQITGRAAA